MRVISQSLFKGRLTGRFCITLNLLLSYLYCCSALQDDVTSQEFIPTEDSSLSFEVDDVERELKESSCQLGNENCLGISFQALFHNEKPDHHLMNTFQTVYQDKEELDVVKEQFSGSSPSLQTSTDSRRNVTVSNDGVYDVIIVGAGWSGLAAAKQLKEQGIYNIKILEARDYIGGRTRTIRDAYDGIDCELGTNWLQYGDTNPLFDLTFESDLNYMSIDDSKFQLFMPWGAINDKKMTAYYEDMYNAWEYRRFAKSYLVDEDESIKISVDEIKSRVDNYSDSFIKKKVLDALIQAYIGYKSDLELQSLFYGVDGERSYLGGYYGYDGYRLISGWSSLIDTFSMPVVHKIQLQSVVTSIKYRKDIVKIFYNDVSDPDIVHKNMIKAKKVIVTLPLGVLKKKVVKFQPALPHDKKTIIDTIGNVRYVKCNLFWNEDDIFWDGIPSSFSDSEMVEGSDLRMTWYNPSYIHSVRHGHLIAEISGTIPLDLEDTYALQDEVKYEEEITKLSMSALRRMFGNNIPDPEKVVVSKWGVDPFAYGTYSQNVVGYTPDMRSKLRKPIDDKIFLAGEHTSTYHHSNAHGATFTGIMAAKKVSKSLFG